MAGHRNASTACVFGLRGVRLAYEEAPTDAIDVRITMCSNLSALRARARDFVARQSFAGHDAPQASAKDSARSRATAKVEDIDGGVRIRVVPADGDDTEELRAELEARIDESAVQQRCD